MIKDIFGTELKVGHVILLSKGERGHRDLELGIIIEFIKAKSVGNHFIKTGYVEIPYSKNAYQLFTKRHKYYLNSTGRQNHIVVAHKVHELSDISLLEKTKDFLIVQKLLPKNYILGVPVIQPEIENLVKEIEEVKVETKEKVISEENLLNMFSKIENLKERNG